MHDDNKYLDCFSSGYRHYIIDGHNGLSAVWKRRCFGYIRKHLKSWRLICIAHWLYIVCLLVLIFCNWRATKNWWWIIIRARCLQAATRECPAEGDSECYCIPKGDCYTYVHKITVDHCHFDRHTSYRLLIKYSVTNQAGLTHSGELVVSSLNTNDLPVVGTPNSTL